VWQGERDTRSPGCHRGVMAVRSAWLSKPPPPHAVPASIMASLCVTQQTHLLSA
jgi:hypothetical protein